MSDLPPGLTVRHLELLSAVGRSTSWTEAGDRVGMAQSSVSQSLARVEALAGVPLFERIGNRRRPTVAGRRLIAAADRVLADLGVAWDDVVARSGRGPLRVGVIDAVALYLRRDRTEHFVTTHPEVDLRLTVDASDRLLDRLDRGVLDVAVVTGPVTDRPAVGVTTEDLRLYGSDDGSGPAVLYPEGSRTRAIIDRGLARLGIEPVVAATAPNPAVLRELARFGVGWTVLPTGVAEAPGVASPEPRGPLVARRPVVAVRRAVGSDPLADAFVAALADDRPIPTGGPATGRPPVPSAP